MNGIRGLEGLPLPLDPAAGPSAPVQGASFADLLGKAVAKVDGLQLAADGEAERSAQGAGNLHETALALEKADVAMRVLTKVRNKVVEAYQEVMRMSV
jgi:flagellar hook-basal body complex protein FliE